LKLLDGGVSPGDTIRNKQQQQQQQTTSLADVNPV
jgi:hypothetical protein